MRILEDVKGNQYTNGILRFLLCLYFFLEFIEPYTNIFLGSYTKFFILILIGFCLIISNFRIGFDGTCKCYVAWIIYKTITLIWAKNYFIFHLHAIGNYSNVFLLCCLAYFSFDIRTIRDITFSLWAGSALIGILSIFSHTAYLGVSSRQVLTIVGQNVDPNNDAAFLAVGIAISLYFLFQENNKIVLSILSLIVLIANVYSTLLTGSRGGLLTCIFILLALGLMYIKDGKHKIIFFIGIILLLFASVYLINNYLPQDISDRLFEFDSYEGGSLRTNIWGNALSMMNSNPLYIILGAGWGSYYGYNGYYVVMHNTFLSIFCDVGVVGFCLFFAPIIKITINLIKDKEILPILLIIAALVPSFFIEAINKRFLWNGIFFILVYYKSWMHQFNLEEYECI